MTEAHSRASSMIKTRAHEMREVGSGGPPIDMPVLQNNLYKLDAWVQPFADAQDMHSQALRENRDQFHTYMSDLQKQLKRHKLHVNTNELVKRVQAQKDALANRLTSNSLALAKALAEQPKAKIALDCPEKDLTMVFEGQAVDDPVKNYRLRKKIQHVSLQLESMIKREKLA